MNKNRQARSKARLKWFLDFLYLDVDSLSRADFFKLLADLGTISRDPFLSFEASKQFSWVDSPEKRQEIKEYRDHLKTAFEHILNLWELRRLEEGSDIEEIFDRERKIGSFKMALTMTILEDRVFFLPPQIKDTLVYEFVHSLNPFSLNHIRKCEREDCGKYFLKATKKEKRYCSNKCAWVMASRKRRASNPAKEKEKKRKSYERRMKRKYGPNVKIQRKTRKGE